MHLINKFFKVNTSEKKWYKIILWWELRRIPYNLTLLLFCFISLYIVSFIPNEGFISVYTGPALVLVTYLSILAYFIGANMLYTLGSIVQIATKNLDNKYVKGIINNLFIIGLIISSIVTLSPIIIVIINYLLGKII